jgi:hypothetical protein
MKSLELSFIGNRSPPGGLVNHSVTGHCIADFPFCLLSGCKSLRKVVPQMGILVFLYFCSNILAPALLIGGIFYVIAVVLSFLLPVIKAILAIIAGIFILLTVLGIITALTDPERKEKKGKADSVSHEVHPWRYRAR